MSYMSTTTTTTRNLNYDHLFKILLIGDSGAGKSSAMFRFCDDKFSSSFISTIGIDFKIKDIYVVQRSAAASPRGSTDNVESPQLKIRMQCWDTAGQEKYRTITTAYFRGAHGIMIFYDVSDETSFNNVTHWLRTIDMASSDSKGVSKVLVASKCDISGSGRLISAERGKELADSVGIPYVEISSKLGLGVDAAFETMATTILKRFATEKITKRTRSLSEHYSIDAVSLSNDYDNDDGKSARIKSDCCL